ncbi:MAG: radical SAM protein [Oscillospiraceae bacterium]|nr:radical SAM protein [Oscillospiraceae bacterium]
MEIIREPSEIIAKTLGEQAVGQDEAVRLASWCVAVPAGDGNILLLNNFTKELVLVENGEDEFLRLPNLSESDVDKIRGSEPFDYLSRHWFIVPANLDDKNLIDEVRSVVSCMNKPEGIIGYTILTTTDCNARCFYCYEQGLERVNMSRQTALDTAEFIKKTAGRKIKLHWFGGEPLFNSSVIDIITDELKKSGIEYHSTMTSNGYLITDSVVKRAVESWNLKGVQITLDGTEEIYNRRKAYAGSKGSAFQRVLGNIEKLLQAGISVSVRMNLDMDNAEDLHKLCDLLADRFSSYEKFGVYAHYIFDGKTADSLYYALDETYIELEKLRSYLREKGLTRRGKLGNTIKVSHCMADKDSSIVISETGKLYKCQHITPTTESFGTIYTGVENPDVIDYWRNRPEDGEICENCPLYADCIRLSACPDDFAFCPQVIYDEKLEKLKNAMLYTYEEYPETKQS